MSANPTVLYRLPDAAEIDRSLRGTEEEKTLAMRKLKKSIARAWESLDSQLKAKVREEFTGSGRVQSLTVETFLAERAPQTGFYYDERRLLVNLIDAMKKHGSPGQTIHPGYGAGRPLQPDEAANLGTIIKRLDAVITGMGTKTYDTYLAGVFGPTKIDDARQMFEDGLATLKDFAKTGKIRVDTINKVAVWRAAGLAGAAHMELPDGKLQKADNETVVVVAHEMTHIIPNGRATGDKYYSTDPLFKTAQEQEKLITAAYYEEVIRQILIEGKPGAPFVPVDQTAANLPVNYALDQYRNEAKRLVNLAWATSINIYDKLRGVGQFAEPHDKANAGKAPGKKVVILPDSVLAMIRNASVLFGLSVHRRPSLLNAHSNPVTPLDLSLLDQRIARLGTLLKHIADVVVMPHGGANYDPTRVDDVLRHALVAYNGNRDSPGVVSNKDVTKDIAVIRTLAELNHAPNWGAPFDNALAAPLPARMNAYG